MQHVNRTRSHMNRSDKKMIWELHHIILRIDQTLLFAAVFEVTNI